MSSKIPWLQIKDLVIELSTDLWNDELKQIQRIIDAAPAEEKQIVVAFQHTIDCSGKLPTVQTKISFSERFTSKRSASVDDPEQLTLGEKPEKP